jgi:uncharacterized protein YecT (DUF1311 family)
VEPEQPGGVQEPVRRLNWTTIALIGALVLLVLLVAYFATRGNSDQDKLTNANVAAGEAPAHEKSCASKNTYELIKRELFRRAAQLRGSDQAAYDRLSAYAVVRMENPVMESENSSTGAVNCSASLALDLPPGVAVVGGRRTLMSDIDYTVQPAADSSGNVVLLRNADPIVTPLATLARTSVPQQQPAETEAAETTESPREQPQPDVEESESAAKEPGPRTSHPGRPSFDCDKARSRSELAVCADGGLSALDLNMATQYRRAIGSASPSQRALLQSTRDRFLRYRDRCPNRQCIADSYVGRMREIRDIMEGTWQPPR